MHFALPLAFVSLVASALPAFALPATSLEERGGACKGSYQCRYVARPQNSGYLCKEGQCTYQCYPGYKDLGNRCVKPSPTTTYYQAPATTTASETAVFPSATFVQDAVKQAGVTGFSGNNSNAILSWFRTNNSADATNGHSWCGSVYRDDVPGFAPSLKTMLANFNGSYEAAATAYCGLEAVITTPAGRNATLYIVDAFDDTWVRTPSSLDVVVGSFPLLFGFNTTNKLDVVQGAEWYLTGRRNARYAFKGPGAVGL
ncbi:hypothetical protein JCM10296v2_004363 [Rhodotorula toruloides]